jgi:acyl dehydratase
LVLTFGIQISLISVAISAAAQTLVNNVIASGWFTLLVVFTIAFLTLQLSLSVLRLAMS